jgi:hypothetical protein
MVEVTITRLAVAWIAGFMAHAVVMQASSKYGSPRGYFLIGSLINAAVFFISLLFIYPLVVQ